MKTIKVAFAQLFSILFFVILGLKPPMSALHAQTIDSGAEQIHYAMNSSFWDISGIVSQGEIGGQRVPGEQIPSLDIGTNPGTERRYILGVAAGSDTQLTPTNDLVAAAQKFGFIGDIGGPQGAPRKEILSVPSCDEASKSYLLCGGLPDATSIQVSNGDIGGTQGIPSPRIAKCVALPNPTVKQRNHEFA